MTIVRAQCSWQWDSAFARDRFVINPHFEMTGALEDADQIAEDLATALKTWAGTVCELVVKTYDVEGTKPVFPNGEAVRDKGLLQTTGVPRELACCLSFYAERNLPRQRGRLFIPAQLLGGNMGNRPSVAQRDKVMALGPILAGIGGVDVDWVVWSTRDKVARKVTNYWCDDEWDVQRSRGLRSTARTQATTSG